MADQKVRPSEAIREVGEDWVVGQFDLPQLARWFWFVTQINTGTQKIVPPSPRNRYA